MSRKAQAAGAVGVVAYVKRRMGRLADIADPWRMDCRHVRAIAAIAATTSWASLASAEPRAIAVSTSLHRCGEGVCLVIAGRRGDVAAPILVAGHGVVAQGERRWRVTLPLPTVREWSAPHARSIAVEVAGADGGATRAALPVGLLGHITEMAYLDVSARR